MKPLVDTIGNVESRDPSLTDCMLELIRCARNMRHLTFEDEDDDLAFWLHVKSVFNHQFHAMNTEVHSPALFLHPMCHKFAISQAASGRSFNFMVTAALKIAKKWSWPEEDARKLVDDMQQYNQCKGPFAGGKADGLDWWMNLAVGAAAHPLKALAINILSIIPHAADVERLFSQLGGVQTAKRCNLTVDTFATLGKCRANYAFHLYQLNRLAGRLTHRRHTHMHTPAEKGICVDLANELEATFMWVPPLTSGPDTSDDVLAGPESIRLDEIDATFDELEKDKQSAKEVDPDGVEVLEGEIYAFNELDKIDEGIVLHAFEEEVSIHREGLGTGGAWNVETMLALRGISG